MTAEITDITDTLESLAVRLIKAPAPQPLTAYDAVDLRLAKKEIERLRGRVAELERVVAEKEDKINNLYWMEGRASD
jgi:hypothetical protein